MRRVLLLHVSKVVVSKTRTRRFLSSSCAWLIFLLGCVEAAPALPGQSFSYTETVVANSQSPVAGSTPGLNTPSGVAVDHAGNLYIVDSGNKRVLKATPAPGGTYSLVVIADSPHNGLSAPYGIAVDNHGNVFITDPPNYRFVEESPSSGGGYTQIASITTNTPPSPHTAPYPAPIAVDAAGNVYVTVVQANTFFTNASYVEKFPVSSGTYSASTATTVYNFTGGSGGLAVDTPGNVYVAVSYPSTEVDIVPPVTGPVNTITGLDATEGLAVDDAGRVYVGDSTHVIRETPSGSTYTASSIVAINSSLGIAIDGNGTVYIADATGNQVLKVQTHSIDFGNNAIGSPLHLQAVVANPSQNTVSPSVTTQGVAGLDFTVVSGNPCSVPVTPGSAPSNCTFDVVFTPTSPGLRMGVLSLGSLSSQQILLRGIGTGPLAAFTPGTISTIAGNGNACSLTTAACGDGGPATAANLFNPNDMVLDGAGNVYIADTTNNRIRKVAPSGAISTVAGTGSTGGALGDGGSALTAQLFYPSGVALDGQGNLYIADTNNHRLRRVDAATGVITTVAGTGSADSFGDGGPATSAHLHNPYGVIADGFGNLLIADTANDEIRRISGATGIITTVAGTHVQAYNGDGGPATTENLFYPFKVAIDSAGDLFIADFYDQRIRKVGAATGIMTTVAGNGTYGFSGDGGLATSATLSYPRSVAVDAAGNLYIADLYSERIRKVDASTGIITTLAGNGTDSSTGDGGAAPNATIGEPAGLNLDAAGNLYIAEFDGQRIRKITAAANPLSFATTALGSTSSDSPQTATLQNIGNTPLTLQPPATTGSLNPSVAAGFSYITLSQSCPQLSPISSPYPLSPGASCDLDLSFTPQTAGTVSGAAVLSDDSLNAASTQSVTLTGTATPGTPIITATSASAVYGASSVILSATVGFSGVPDTGAVTFTIGSGTPGTATCTVSGSRESCSATYNPTALAAGPHPIHAAVAADSNYFAATASSTLTITPATPAITVSAASSPYGTSTTTLTATLSYAGAIAPSPLTLTVDNGSALQATCSGATSPQTCTAPYQTNALAAGSHIITAATPVTTNDNAASATATLTIAKAAATLTTNAVSVVYGTTSTSLTASLAYPGPLAPSGSPTFAVDNNAQVAATCTGTASPLACTANYNTTNLTGGTHTITLGEAGDANYLPATGTAVLSISPASVTLAVAPASTPYGTATTSLTANLSYPGALAPSGPFAFSIDGGPGLTATCLGATSPIRCTANLDTSRLVGGAHTAVAFLAADADYTAATGSATLAVTPLTPVLTLPGGTSVFGAASIPLSATIAYAGPAAPSGTLLFNIDAGQNLPATCAISPALLTCTLNYASSTLAAGPHTITATLPADTNYISARQTASLTTTQAQPTIAWPSPPSISYGTVLTSAQLNATANIPGTFLYSPPAGTLPPLGTLTLLTTFQPADATDYTTTTKSVTLLVTPLPPTCSLSVQGTPTALVVVAVTQCTDPQNQPLSSTISWGDNTTSAAAPRVFHTYAAAGTYTVTLTAMDTSKLSTTIRQQITPNQLPVCTLGSIQGTSATSNAVSMTSTCSDPQGQPLTASIDWGDGTGPHAALPNGLNPYTYTNVSGTTPYQVTLTATDSAGLTGTATQSVLLLPVTKALAPGATVGITAVLTPQPPSVQAVTATFLCSSVTFLTGGSTLTSLPSQYGITCTSPVFTVDASVLPPIDVDIHSTAGNPTIASRETTEDSPLLAGVFWLPFPGLSLLALGGLLPAASRRPRRRLQSLGALLMLCLPLASCGGHFTPPPVTATPTGAYTITLTEVIVCPTSATGCPPPPTGFIQTSLIKPLTVGKP